MRPSNANKLKHLVPKPLYPPARFLYRRVVIKACFKSIEAADFLFGRRYEGQKLPPATLRYQVQMSPSGMIFAKIGRRISSSIIEGFQQASKAPSSISNVLDFGCGCGRTLIWLKDSLPNVRLYGTDTDKKLISWCKKRLSFATFTCNNFVPPLEYKDESFDAIYAISVFTHMNEEFQMLWLKELNRIAKPGGIVLLSLLGENSWDQIPEAYLEQARKKGFLFLDRKSLKGLLPDWYQAAFHSKSYVEETFSKYFNVLKYLPQGVNHHQDLVVLEKP